MKKSWLAIALSCAISVFVSRATMDSRNKAKVDMRPTKTIKTLAGLEMPLLIYGTAWKKEKTAALVEKAVLLGFRGIDTACQPKHYHEPGVGEALAKLSAQGIKRSDFFIQTKFTPLSGQDPNSIPYDKDAPLPEQVLQSFAKSQINLDTDYVDSLVLHSPLQKYEQLRSVWSAMEVLHARGMVRQLGISNCYDLALLKKLSADVTVKPSVVQNRFYHETGYDGPLRAWCKEQGIVYQSFWTLTANPHVLESKLFQNYALRYHRTPAQILFRFLTLTGIAPLTGTSSEMHMKEDLEIFDFDLPQETLTEIEHIFIGG